MQDGFFEAGVGGEVRIAVQRIAVARQAVDQGLARQCLEFHHVIGGPHGRFRQRLGRTSGSAITAIATGEKNRLHGAEFIAAGFIPGPGALISPV